MKLPRRSGTSLLAGWIAALLAAGLTCGCESPAAGAGRLLGGPPRRSASGEIDAERVPTRDDIVAIRQFWSQYPWLRRGDRIVGFQAAVHFLSGQTSKGAFVPGRIFVWLYEVPPGATDDNQRQLLYMWELDEQQAMGYRVRRESVLGYFYGFVLAWDDSVQVAGRLVEIVFGYERGDGRLILGAPQRFRVPLTGAPGPTGSQPA